MNDEKIRIVTKSLDRFPKERKDTNFAKIQETNDPVFLSADIYNITSEDVNGRLPSKIWCDADGKIKLLYYTASNLNVSNNIYLDKQIYCFHFDMEADVTIEYPGFSRIFMDQFQVGNRMICVVIFSENEYNDIIYVPIEIKKAREKTAEIEEKLVGSMTDSV